MEKSKLHKSYSRLHSAPDFQTARRAENSAASRRSRQLKVGQRTTRLMDMLNAIETIGRSPTARTFAAHWTTWSQACRRWWLLYILNPQHSVDEIQSFIPQDEPIYLQVLPPHGGADGIRLLQLFTASERSSQIVLPDSQCIQVKLLNGEHTAEVLDFVRTTCRIHSCQGAGILIGCLERDETIVRRIQSDYALQHLDIESAFMAYLLLVCLQRYAFSSKLLHRLLSLYNMESLCTVVALCTKPWQQSGTNKELGLAALIDYTDALLKKYYVMQFVGEHTLQILDDARHLAILEKHLEYILHSELPKENVITALSAIHNMWWIVKHSAFSMFECLDTIALLTIRIIVQLISSQSTSTVILPFASCAVPALCSLISKSSSGVAALQSVLESIQSCDLQPWCVILLHAWLLSVRGSDEPADHSRSGVVMPSVLIIVIQWVCEAMRNSEMHNLIGLVAALSKEQSTPIEAKCDIMYTLWFIHKEDSDDNICQIMSHLDQEVCRLVILGDFAVEYKHVIWHGLLLLIGRCLQVEQDLSIQRPMPYTSNDLFECCKSLMKTPQYLEITHYCDLHHSSICHERFEGLCLLHDVEFVVTEFMACALESDHK